MFLQLLIVFLETWKCKYTLLMDSLANMLLYIFMSDSVSVRLGEHKISNTTDCENNEDEVVCADPVQDIPVDTVVKHSKYSRLNKINDIAIIRLKRDAVLNGYVKTICLPTQRSVLISNIDTSATMAISGWGKENRF